MNFNQFLSLQVLGNSLGGVFLAIIVFFITYIAIFLFKKYLAQKISVFVQSTKTKIDDILFDSLLKFLNIGGLFCSFFIAVHFLKFSLNLGIIVNNFIVIIGTTIITWITQDMCMHLLDEYFKKLSENLKKSFLPFFKNVLNIFLWTIAVTFILANLGYKISSLAAGLGIGGLAIALAIQPTLEAFLASVSVFTDRSFKIGDVIKFKGFSGTVKKIGMRTTKIKTFFGTEVIVPNKELISSEVENITKREGHRIDAKIGVTYETSTKNLKNAIKIIKEVIKKQENIFDDLRVWFDAFGDFALIISITYFVEASLSFTDRMEIVSNINMAIKEQFEKHGIDMAYPTQKVYFTNDAITLK